MQRSLARPGDQGANRTYLSDLLREREGIEVDKPKENVLTETDIREPGKLLEEGGGLHGLEAVVSGE